MNKQYTPDLIRTELFLEDVPVKTKFGVAHGGRGSSAELARQSARAMLRGEVDQLIFAGGVRVFDPLTLAGIFSFNSSYFFEHSLRDGFKRAAEFLSPQKEALLMADIAMQEGVSSRDIIVEGNGVPTSRHTGQNVDNLLSQTDGLLEDVVQDGALKVFGLAYNTRRACSVWDRKLNKDRNHAVIIVPRSFYPYGFTSENWHKSKDIRERIVYPEMAKIDPENEKSHLKTTNDVTVYDAALHSKRAMASLPGIILK
ncbi:MAG: YdcF family protein [Alphaproteobacteria bacterium]|nr:YdcF family protein [Alphaproteobacteria bacterium]NCQ87951.1 YdcF family protein [Alphaproteobacteria bacterium]NCT05542.1 YdcF family protein [Alphaproteobacteria bacterium]